MSRPDITTLSKETIVAFIGDIFERRGAESYLGEQVTMSEHMLQGAEFRIFWKTLRGFSSHT